MSTQRNQRQAANIDAKSTNRSGITNQFHPQRCFMMSDEEDEKNVSSSSDIDPLKPIEISGASASGFKLIEDTESVTLRHHKKI